MPFMLSEISAFGSYLERSTTPKTNIALAPTSKGSQQLTKS